METLLAHEWTTAGWSEPLRSEAKARPSLRDDIIADMEARFGWSRDAIEAALAAHHVSSQVEQRKTRAPSVCSNCVSFARWRQHTICLSTPCSEKETHRKTQFGSWERV
jgi:hypothetical protein